MKKAKKKVRALGLCSGGLDSILSALILKRQGVDVVWVSFETPFFSSANAGKAAKNTGIPLIIKNITEEYLKMLQNPPCGYGKYMNPCMDCHALMFRLAGDLMPENNMNFLFSGEVLGQRPMSQNKQSLRYVEKQSGFDGYILRPLSAKRLPETIPEKTGLVDRNRLLGISGRSRKPQIQLAKEFGVDDYPSPAGGCLLTDKGFAARLKDLFDHKRNCTENDCQLLKFGRHLRLDSKTKIIVGRTQKDNESIKKYYLPEADTLIKMKTIPGPMVLIPDGGSKEMRILSASVCAGYSKAQGADPAEVNITTPQGHEVIKVFPLPPKNVRHFLI
jgi:tRNA U34 2-thiouridine synthase MnmA/TrmU